jgi:aminobenzoyl-glutamate transport protein
MLPYSIGLLVSGIVLLMGWVALDLPLGPGASVHIPIPTTAP